MFSSGCGPLPPILYLAVYSPLPQWWTNNNSPNLYFAQILSTIDQSPVTIVEGPTGCGKTTQIPHWILKNCYDKRQYCNIVVTQPRRIAAISVAKRVCEENNYEMSTIVGYQVYYDCLKLQDILFWKCAELLIVWGTQVNMFFCVLSHITILTYSFLKIYSNVKIKIVNENLLQPLQ